MSLELRQRLIGASIAVFVLLFFFLVLPEEYTFLLALGCALQAWREYSRMMGLKDRQLLHYYGFLWLTLSMCLSYFTVGKLGMSWFWIWLAFFGGFFLLGVERLVLKQIIDVTAAWRDLCRFVMGTSYLFLLFGFIGPVMGMKNGLQILITGIAAISIADTTAYFVGKKWGKNKFWPEISPGKTWEGVYGSLVGSFLGSLVVWVIFYLTHTSTFLFASTLVVGLFVGPLSIMGDMLESLMKRASGMKDTGTLIQGHGGILDRADGFALVIPLLYLLFAN